jgi:hypothetical protein
VGNRPELTQTNWFAFRFGSLYVRAYGARLLKATEMEFSFAAEEKPGRVIITNEAAEPRKVRVCAVTKGRSNCQERTLASQEEWNVEIRMIPQSGNE